MARKLYVGNLSFNTTEEELKTFIAQAGSVESVTIVTDKFTGQSRGFGFVEMGNEAAAQQAIQQLNGQTLDGQTLIVNEARPQERRSGGFGGGERRRGGRTGGRRGRW